MLFCVWHFEDTRAEYWGDKNRHVKVPNLSPEAFIKSVKGF